MLRRDAFYHVSLDGRDEGVSASVPRTHINPSPFLRARVCGAANTTLVTRLGLLSAARALVRPSLLCFHAMLPHRTALASRQHLHWPFNKSVFVPTAADLFHPARCELESMG
jgi:hypothetical protein